VLGGHRIGARGAIIPSVANIAFSICMGIASLAVAVLAASKGVVVVALIWGALAVGFAVRAELGRRRRG
jgi:Flp pilus assembly protein TadB